MDGIVLVLKMEASGEVTPAQSADEASEPDPEEVEE